MSKHYFDELASDNPAERLRAAHGLLTELSAAEDGGQQIEYSLKRLIRGLASGRKSSRVGFSLVLAELLSQLLNPADTRLTSAGFNFDALLALLESATKPEGKASGQDTRDHYIGRLFGLEALLTAVIQNEIRPTEHWHKVLDLLFKLAREKSWMQEQCLWTLYSALPKCPITLIQSVVDHLRSSPLEKTPGGVAIYVRASQIAGPQILDGSNWLHKDPLDPRDFSLLSKVMKEATMTDHDVNDNASVRLAKGTWVSKLHFAWDIILQSVDQRSTAHSYPDLFGNFWTMVVDENLFGPNASDERKSWGFRLIPHALRLDLSHFLIMLEGPNFIRCVGNHSFSKERALYKASLKAVSEITAVALQPEALFRPNDLFQVLLSSGPGPFYDAFANYNAMGGIIAQTDKPGLRQILASIEQFVYVPNRADSQAADSMRQLCLDLLVVVTRKVSAKRFDAETQDALKLIAQVAYSNKDGQFIPALTAKIQDVSKERLLSILGNLYTARQPQIENWPYVVMKHASEMEGLKLEGRIGEAQRHALDAISQIELMKHDADMTAARHLESFGLLLATILLTLFNGDADSLELLEEILVIAKVTPDAKLLSSAVPSIVEAILSLVSRPSSFFKAVASIIFETFADDVDGHCVESLINVLVTSESVQGQKEMFDEDDEDGFKDAMDIDSDVSLSEASDVEISSMESLTDTPTSDSDIEDSENDENPQNNEELEALNLALADVLRTRDDEQMMGEDSDGSDMDDEQMMALDEHLSTIFKEKLKNKSKKTDDKKAKAFIVNFKMRVLDLISIFFKTQTTSPLTLDLIQPLLELIRKTKEKDVASKATESLRQFMAKSTKDKKVPTINDENAAWSVLQAIHNEATRDASTIHANICSSMSTLLVKSLVTADHKNIDAVVDMYAATWKLWLTKRNCKVQPRFFSDFVNWSTSAAKQLQR